MQLLAELDGFDELEHVKIIAATNRPDILDDAYCDQVDLIELSKYQSLKKSLDMPSLVFTFPI